MNVPHDHPLKYQEQKQHPGNSLGPFWDGDRDTLQRFRDLQIGDNKVTAAESPGPLFFSKKSPTGPTERTPKPEYLIARSQLTEGSVGKVPFNFSLIFH